MQICRFAVFFAFPNRQTHSQTFLSPPSKYFFSSSLFLSFPSFLFLSVSCCFCCRACCLLANIKKAFQSKARERTKERTNEVFALWTKTKEFSGSHFLQEPTTTSLLFFPRWQLVVYGYIRTWFQKARFLALSQSNIGISWPNIS